MKTYNQLKEAARQQAIDYQLSWAYLNYSYYEITLAQDKFCKLGKKYGLTKEFRENGII
jgi:hypothetical protein